MSDVHLSIREIFELVEAVLLANGCDAPNAAAVARTVSSAERDGAVSHGMFRVPGYVVALRNGRVRGDAEPDVQQPTRAFVRVDAKHGFAPLALERGIPELARAAHELGIAVMTVIDSFHFAALWPEVEALADEGLAGIACVNYASVMAPHGGSRAIFGTNPLAYAWPRNDKAPVVADMATSAMARGELMLAKRAGRSVPPGNGLGPDGEASTDPAAILSGVQLPFGGHKGSAIALMVELLAASATGDRFSDEVVEDVSDGGPPPGGEILIALSPKLLGGERTQERTEAFLDRLSSIPGVRLPGSQRHRERLDDGPRVLDAALVDKLRGLL
ncbi:MAG: Ldh family oxidoreductase [Halieaceae bacterium]|jgi:delta1-piperideine-2-carboxylate reductase|nr:Ldh family oxidoreductase [Halieaceae bacterium]